MNEATGVAMAGAETPRDHVIPAPLDEVERALDADHADRAAAGARRLLVSVLRAESIRRGDELKKLYRAGSAPLAAALEELLRRANYRELTQSELQQAFDSQALMAIRTKVDMTQFSALRIHARGKSRRAETLRTLWGLRRRTVEFDVLERVFVFSVTPSDPVPNAKLFRSIPVPDLEMLLPNIKVCMRRLDQAAVAIPAAVSVATMASKLALSFTAVVSTVMFMAGLSKDEPAGAEGWGIVAATSFALFGIASGAWTNYQRRRFQYASQHARTLYFQCVASETAAFLRVLDEAFEEEAKEAALAWSFLAAEGPRTEADLDARIEGWLHERLGVRCDFEVDDALAKLERLGVATRSGAGEGATWTAVAPDAAAATLRARWDAAAG
jgi:hypothetical protein